MYKVMIVDDELISKEMIQEYLEAKLPSFEVVSVCSNGKEALDSFSKEPVDIILVDICMPIMDGLTLIKRLSEISRDYVPILISSYGEFEYAKTAMHLGVTNYLLKPLDFKELTAALEDAVRKLTLNRIPKPLDCLDEEREIFISDILDGKYTESAKALESFNTLNFPFSYEHAAGIYIHTEFIVPPSWIYGKDALYTALSNLIDFVLSPIYQVPLVRKYHCCNFFLILNNNTVSSFEQLILQAQTLLNLTLSVQILYHFDSIEHLRKARSSTEPNPDDLPAMDEIEINIRKAITYIGEHYAEDLTRDDIASKVYMSGSYFSIWFKKATNTTYKDFLTEIRMQKAIDLLKTNLQIKDIAARTGYSSIARFNINFKAYTSYTPSEYRRLILKMQ